MQLDMAYSRTRSGRVAGPLLLLYCIGVSRTTEENRRGMFRLLHGLVSVAIHQGLR